LCFECYGARRALHSFPTRRSSDLEGGRLLAYFAALELDNARRHPDAGERARAADVLALLTPLVKAFLTESALESTSLAIQVHGRSEEHTSELQSRENLVCRLLLEK